MPSATPTRRMTVAFVMAAAGSAAVAALSFMVPLAWNSVAQWPILSAIAFVVALVIALPHALILGAPLYLALFKERPPTLGAALLASVCIAVIPLGVIGAASLGDDPDWFSFGMSLGYLALCGAGGGIVFWALMRSRGRT